MILVIEWGRTKIEIVRHALDTAPNLHQLSLVLCSTKPTWIIFLSTMCNTRVCISTNIMRDVAIRAIIRVMRLRGLFRVEERYPTGGEVVVFGPSTGLLWRPANRLC